MERAAEEPGLHAGEEVLEREDPADPGHPRRRVVPERDEDPGQEEQRQDDRVDDRCEASAFGMTDEIANPSAQNAAAPTTSMISMRTRVAPVGMSAL